MATKKQKINKKADAMPLSKKAARKELTGINLAAIKRKLARLEFRLKVVEQLLETGPIERAVKSILKGKWK